MVVEPPNRTITLTKLFYSTTHLMMGRPRVHTTQPNIIISIPSSHPIPFHPKLGFLCACVRFLGDLEFKNNYNNEISAQMKGFVQ